MSEEIKELHDKISLLDDKFDGLHTQQALISQSVSQMAAALDKLVDLRAETLLIMQQCEVNTREHDELFGRVRKLEDAKAACPILHQALNDEIETLKEDRIKPLENNQRKVAWLVIAFVILAVLALVVT
ncbi:hypothetical protein KAR91_75675 [Candidatus Pacearchaeota archaeon]|nr:hypothetical protein [Candidatus Pacearchaeota archaeon]